MQWEFLGCHAVPPLSRIGTVEGNICQLYIQKYFESLWSQGRDPDVQYVETVSAPPQTEGLKDDVYRTLNCDSQKDKTKS